MVTLFRVTGHFETRAPNDPQMTLNAKRSKVPHTHTKNTPESQISFRFPVQPVIFELQTILRRVHPITPKWPETLKGQRWPIYMLQLCKIFKFHFVLICYRQPFSTYRPFWDKCTDDPKLKCPWTMKDQRYLMYMLQLPPSPKFHSVSLCD